MERKELVLSDVVLKADETSGIIEGIANVGNYKDLQGDTMLPGCWSKVIREGQSPAFCWGHDTKDIRGKVIQLVELQPGDPRIAQNQKAGGRASGLWFQAQMATKVQAGRDAFELLRGGFIKQLSVQFTVAKDGEESDGKGGRNVKEVGELFEISAVLKGASEGTRVLVAKEDIPSEPTSETTESHVTATTVKLLGLGYALGYLEGRKNTKEGKPNA